MHRGTITRSQLERFALKAIGILRVKKAVRRLLVRRRRMPFLLTR